MGWNLFQRSRINAQSRRPTRLIIIINVLCIGILCGSEYIIHD